MQEEMIGTAAPRTAPPPIPGTEATTPVPGSALAGGTAGPDQAPDAETTKAEAWWSEDNAAIDITNTMGESSDTSGTLETLSFAK